MASGSFRSVGVIRRLRVLRLGAESSRDDGVFRLLTVLVLLLPLLLAAALQHRM